MITPTSAPLRDDPPRRYAAVSISMHSICERNGWGIPPGADALSRTRAALRFRSVWGDSPRGRMINAWRTLGVHLARTTLATL